MRCLHIQRILLKPEKYIGVSVLATAAQGSSPTLLHIASPPSSHFLSYLNPVLSISKAEST